MAGKKMAGVNQVNLLGRLGSDPEIRVASNKDLFVTLSIATSRQWKDKSTGEAKELVEWHRVLLVRRLAEIARDFLKKGSQVYISGYLRTQKWTDSNGIERWTTSIIGESLQLIDSKPKSETSVTSHETSHHMTTPQDELSIIDDEPPF